MAEVRIQDLKPMNENAVRKVDPTKDLPKKVEEAGPPDPVEKAYSQLDKKVEELEQQALEAIKKNNERILDEKASNEHDADASEHTDTEKAADETEEESSKEKEDDKTKVEKLAELRLNKLKMLLKDKIKPVTDEIDLSTFTINKKPDKVFQLFDMQTKDKFIADWLLPAGNKVISMEEFTGTEIDALDPNNSSRTPLNTLRDILYSIWNHIKNTNKPPFENWLKVTKFSDLEHLYFAIYKASFDGVNTVPYYCSSDKCDEVFIKDVDIMEMVKFKDDADKLAFTKALTRARDSHYSEADNEIELACVQITNNLAFAVKEPTLFSVQIEPLYLSEKFREEHSDLISIVSYIEDIYFINRAKGSLDPVGYKEYDDSVAKTVVSKYRKYIEILESLTSDQLYTLQAIISKLNENSMEVKYVLPAQTCPKCGAKIQEEERSATDILFTRHQLAALANM